ncbi:MAG: hypothetical protein Q8R47_01080 [Nanoarchaeota archaeon]|nr:hypothetical protein [Nanoarchaeota archaeon]
MSFTSLSKEDQTAESSSQDLLDLKEDDILRLNRIDVTDSDNCELPGWVIKLNIIKPNGEKNNPFGISEINIPVLLNGQKYSLVFDKTVYIDFNGFKTPTSKYLIYSDDKPTKESFNYRGTQQLSYEGTWSISAGLSRDIESDKVQEENNPITVFFKDENLWVEPDFKVSDKSVHIERRNQRVDFWANIAVIILAVLAIIYSRKQLLKSVELFEKEQEQKKKDEEDIQKDLLRSIETQLRCIHRDILGHQEELNKNPPVVPSYDITHLDANYYITNLRSKIAEYETEILKETIILLSNKIKNINRLLQLAQEYDSNIDSNTLLNPHVREIKTSNYKYHKHLDNLIKKVRNDVNNILLHKHPNLIKKHFKK